MSANVVTRRSDTGGAALAYARRGWPVFPLAPGAKVPLRRSRGLRDATRDEGAVVEQWERDPSRNVGIRTGAAGGLVVLDVDGDEGAESLRRLEAEHGPLPRTRTVTTPSGGCHLYFRHPGADVPCSAGRLAPGLDVRADGGYVVAPPSRSAENGESYAVAVDADPADLPAWLFVLMLRDPRPEPRESPDSASSRTPVATDDAGTFTPHAHAHAHVPHVEGARERAGSMLDHLVRDIDEGRAAREPIAGMPPLPKGCGRQQRRLYALMLAVFEGRMAYGEQRPAPVPGSLVARRLGFPDTKDGHRRGRAALDSLAARGMFWSCGEAPPSPGWPNGSRLWLPGPEPDDTTEPEGGWWVLPADDPAESAEDRPEGHETLPRKPAAPENPCMRPRTGHTATVEPRPAPPLAARDPRPPRASTRPTPDALIVRALERAETGTRNDTGFWLACQIRDAGYVEREATAAVLEYRERVRGGDHPYTSNEARRSVWSAYKEPPRDPWGDPGRDPT